MYFNQVEFGQRIRELRRTGGLTQEALSEQLNISTDQLRKMECGSRGPSLDLLISLAVYFDVSTDYLLMGRDYVNLHSRKRLEGVLQELSGIIATSKMCKKDSFSLDFLPRMEYNKKQLEAANQLLPP